MPDFLIVFLLLLAAAYVALLLAYRLGWSRTPAFSLEEMNNISRDSFPQRRSAGSDAMNQPDVSSNPEDLLLPSVSVIIPARNEAAHIGACLAALKRQHYPEHLLEIIVVNDASEDDTAAIAAGFEGVKILDLKAEKGMVAYKKMALSAGIAHSKGEWIVTTDADCVAGENWLISLALFHQQTNARMIAAPVVFEEKSGLLSVFQSLDFMTMQGITGAVLRYRLGSMANGANLAFTRAAFESVKGYEGATHLASGDDYLLMNKLRITHKEGLFYLKSKAAIVTTQPQPDLTSFFNQRVRWASKSGKYKDPGVTLMLLLVYVFNLSLLAFFVSGFWQTEAWRWLWKILVIKTFAELLLLYPVADFFERKKQLWYFPFLQPLHILYVVAAGFFGMIGSYSWKGRKVR